MKVNFWYCISFFKILAINNQSLAFPEHMTFHILNLLHLNAEKGEVENFQTASFLKALTSQGLRNQNFVSGKRVLTLLWIHVAEGSVYKLLLSSVLECEAGISSLQSYKSSVLLVRTTIKKNPK